MLVKVELQWQFYFQKSCKEFLIAHVVKTVFISLETSDPKYSTVQGKRKTTLLTAFAFSRHTIDPPPPTTTTTNPHIWLQFFLLIQPSSFLTVSLCSRPNQGSEGGEE